MILPVQVTFRGLDASPALRELIDEEARKLERFYGDAISCRVAIECAAGHHQKGKPFHVRIELGVPGDRLVVDSKPNSLANSENDRRVKSAEIHPEQKDAVLAVRDAFRTMGRLLEDFARRQRGEAKVHGETRAHAHVVKLFPLDGFGFLEAADGREVYFHRASVLDGGFDRLTIGSRVAFVEEDGEKGPQATTVKLLARVNEAG
jgi:cold shock CspA family protein/ribosome-associated translation inhibitor RaiA